MFENNDRVVDDPLDTTGHEEQYGSNRSEAGEESAEDQNQEPITDINELDLVTESMESVDVDKLEERMSYAPSLKPGFYNFRFKLNEETPVESVQIKNRTFVQFNWEAVLQQEDEQTHEVTEGRTIRFCRTNNYRSGKMEASRLDELLFSLGKLERFQETERKPSDAYALLQEAEAEGRVIRGQIIWTFYDKATQETYSTSPQKPYKKGDGTTVTELPWPKDGQGNLERIPGGREEIKRVMPTKETLDELHQAKEAGQEAA